ncbi:MAG: glycosyltransferase [Moorella sp. (in: firmicutes)]
MSIIHHIHIALTTIWPIPHTGGVSSHITLLEELLKESATSVSIETPAEAAVIFDMTEGKSDLVSENLMVIGERLGRYLKYAYKGQRVIIHAHDAVACYGVLQAETGLPIVLTVHGYLADEYAAVGAVKVGSDDYNKLLELERESYTHADAIIAVDTRIAGHIKRMAKRESEIIVNTVNPQLYEGIDMQTSRQKLGLPLNRFILLCPRRLTEKNGVRYAIEALKIFSQDIPNVLLVIAGEGEQRHELEILVEKLAIKERCVFVGSVPHEMMPYFYTAADVVLVPSVHASGVEEATSIAALEAMASGKALVASAVGGLKEIIKPGINGILVEQRNPTALAEAVQRVLSNEDFRNKLGQQAKQYVLDHFGPQRFIKAVNNVYARVLNKSKLLADTYYGLPRETRDLDRKIEEQISIKIPGIKYLHNNKPRIAFLAVHNRLTGGAKVFFEHARQLKFYGIPVAIFSYEPKPEWLNYDIPWLKVSKGNLLPFINQFDIVVAMFWTAIPEIMRSSVPVKVLLEQGDPSLFEPENMPEHVYRYMRACYQAPVAIISVSRILDKLLRQRFHRSSIIIPNGIDTNLFQPATKKTKDYYTILFVGPDALPFKGIKDGLLAVQKLKEKGYKLKILQISSGGQELYNFEREVVVRPAPDVLVKLYQEADVYVNCSWYESFPLPPLEAMACGTPVVSTDNGGINEYGIPGKNFLLARVKDPESIAIQIERLLKSPELREKMREEGLRTAQKFTLEKAAAAFAGALLQIAEGKHLQQNTVKSVDVELYHQMAGSLVEEGDLAAAQNVMQVALILDPDNVDSMYNMAFILYVMNRFQESLAWVKRILRLNPCDSDAKLLFEQLQDKIAN